MTAVGPRPPAQGKRHGSEFVPVPASSNPVPLVVPGAASLALRHPLAQPPQRARVLAATPLAIYLELPPSAAEPRVIVIAAASAPRLPNSISLLNLDHHFADVTPAEAWIGRGTAQAGELSVRALRWWDPSPVLGPLSCARLEQGAAALQRSCATASATPSLADHDGPGELAACCASGDLAGAVEASDRMVGLGPGLAPGGDSMIGGLLLALRLLGGAIPGGTRAVWLADWLGAAVTTDAVQRTTSLGATLLHCASRGQAAAEVSAVLRGLAGQEPLGPAVRKLLASTRTATHPAGADLAWGLIAGCRAALALAQPSRG